MSFPRYPRYKPSGVEWLGGVPEHWEVVGLTKYLASVVDYRGRTPTKVDEGTFLLTARNIRDGQIDYEASQEFIADNEYDEVMRRGKPVIGDVVFTTEAPLGQVANIDRTEVAVAQRVIKLSGQPGILDNYFLKYWIMGRFCQSDMAQLATGSTALGIKGSKVGQVRLCKPSVSEQTKIAAFLDQETAKIDELVAEQRRLMELLKEKRQAVISHAVTQGLNPKAPMKPSGIEWLGDVPDHWEVLKMKWVAEMQSGHTPDKKIPAYWEDGDIPWVSLNDTGFLKDNDYITETAYSISSQGLANSSARMLPERVVVFSRDATIGRCAITTRPMAVSQHFIAWVCGENIVPEYLLLRLRSMTGELDRLTTGATLKTIGMPDVRTLVTPLPPLKEQQEIVKWVSEETAKLDTLTAEAQRAIDLLQERRTALISAAVTGQIDVRALSLKQPA